MGAYVKLPPGEAIARRAAAHRRVLDDLVRQMHEDYRRPMSLNAVGRKYSRTGSCVRGLFALRGLKIRPSKEIARQPNGSPAPYVPLTEAQINALIRNARRFATPRALKFEWRRWSWERRGAFIARLRAKFKRPEDRPERPFSPNVEPFDYASPHAQAIAGQVNAGLGSRQRRTTLKLVCQGVIYEGQLWFWSAKVGYCRGARTPRDSRPSLHHHIWEQNHHRPVPAGCVVRFVDGNPNNFAPGNLALASRNIVARENQAAALTEKSRATIAQLLELARV